MLMMETVGWQWYAAIIGRRVADAVAIVAALAGFAGALVVTAAGVPPLSCFWSKFLPVTAAFTPGGGVGPTPFMPGQPG